MCTAAADGMHHEMVTHLGLTHIGMRSIIPSSFAVLIYISPITDELVIMLIVSEGIILAVHRQFAKSHPIYKLLEHHMQFTLAINQLGMLHH